MTLSDLQTIRFPFLSLNSSNFDASLLTPHFVLAFLESNKSQGALRRSDKHCSKQMANLFWLFALMELHCKIKNA